MTLDRIAQTVWRQRLVVLAVAVLAAVAFVYATTKGRAYTATSTILVIAAPAGNGVALDPQQDPAHGAVGPQDLPNLILSATVLGRVARDLRLPAPQAARLGREIKAKAPLNSNVVPIAVTDPDPERAVAVANAVTGELQRFEREIATTRYDAFVRDLDAQLAARRAHLEAIDGRIAQISSADPYVSAETGTAAINARLVQLQQQRDGLRGTLLGDASAAAVAAGRPVLARRLADREIVQNDPLFQTLRGQLGKDQAQLDAVKAGYTDRYPGLPGLQDQVSREGASLARTESRATAEPGRSATYVATLLDKNKADAAYASDRAQLAALDAQIAAMSGHLGTSRGAGLSLAALRRDRDAATQADAALSDRRAIALADRSQAASIASIVVLDRAVGASPPLLSRPPVLAAALGLAALWLALTLAFLLDGSDHRLRTRTTIEDLYGGPVLTYVG